MLQRKDGADKATNLIKGGSTRHFPRLEATMTFMSTAAAAENWEGEIERWGDMNLKGALIEREREGRGEG